MSKSTRIYKEIALYMENCSICTAGRNGRLGREEQLDDVRVYKR